MAENNQQGGARRVSLRRPVTSDVVVRAGAASTQRSSFPGRVGPQQQRCDPYNLRRLGSTIAIHPLIKQHFVEIYHCLWSEGTLRRWLGELWTRTAVSKPPVFLVFSAA